MENTGDTLQLQILNAKKELPEISVAAIDAINWKSTLRDISKKYSPEQQESLEIETELMFCGLVGIEDFPTELENRMKLSHTEVLLLLAEMDKQIFKKIQEDLEKRLAQKEKEVSMNRKFVFDPRFGHLPRENQEAISLSGWKEKLFEIAGQFKISIDKQGVLEETTAETLAGRIKASDYGNELKTRIGLDDAKNKELIDVINEKIFKNIKELLVSGSIKKKVAPPPPYKKTVTSEQTTITTTKEKTETPKPSTTMFVENIKIPEEKPAIKEYTKEQVDPYREHGIEIVEEGESEPKEDLASIKNRETIKSIEEKSGVPLVNKAPNSYVKPSIMANKLMNKTVSNNTVTDYSLPKITGTPHDPYHEEI